MYGPVCSGDSISGVGATDQAQSHPYLLHTFERHTERIRCTISHQARMIIGQTESKPVIAATTGP
jgi:hypothetical protein